MALALIMKYGKTVTIGAMMGSVYEKQSKLSDRYLKTSAGK